MDKETAVKVTTRLAQCIDLLSEVVQIAHDSPNETESKIIRRGVGFVLSEIQDRLADPIYREHPDLIPEKANYTPLPGATLSDMAKNA